MKFYATLVALALGVVPVLGQTTVSPGATATTTPAPDVTSACSSVYASLLSAAPQFPPDYVSWQSEVRANRTTVPAGECVPLVEPPASLLTQLDAWSQAGRSWESAHSSELESYASRCSGFESSRRSSAITFLEGVVSSQSSCLSKTRRPATTTASTTSTSTASVSQTNSTAASTTAASTTAPPTGGSARSVGGVAMGVFTGAVVFAGLMGCM